jgi:hypothetical protein
MIKAMTARAAISVGVFCVQAIAGDWTAPAEMIHDEERCVSYRARLQGEFLLVEATHYGGWYTYAMDNKKRAEEKLAGKPSLGIDMPTEIKLSDGLEAAGPWLQTPPQDSSKPELQWFTWTFKGQALFAAKVRQTGAGPARIAIGGQVCDGSTCKKVDLALSLPLTAERESTGDPKGLIPVR